MGARYSFLAFVGLILGAFAALPIYARLPEAFQIPPNMFFLTLATMFVCWILGALMHIVISELMRGYS